MIRCIGFAGGDVGELAGALLASYDPAGNDGNGAATWTHDPAEALVFDDLPLAMEFRLRSPASRPLRLDGKPNRPLTVFAVEYLPVPEPSSASPPPKAGPVSLADDLRAMGLM
jgi:hypothetical protein